MPFLHLHSSPPPGLRGRFCASRDMSGMIKNIAKKKFVHDEWFADFWKAVAEDFANLARKPFTARETEEGIEVEIFGLIRELWPKNGQADSIRLLRKRFSYDMTQRRIDASIHSYGKDRLAEFLKWRPSMRRLSLWTEWERATDMLCHPDDKRALLRCAADIMYSVIRVMAESDGFVLSAFWDSGDMDFYLRDDDGFDSDVDSVMYGRDSKLIALVAWNLGDFIRKLLDTFHEYFDAALFEAFRNSGMALSIPEHFLFSSRKDAVKRIAAERPNLVPLIGLIRKSAWDESDLFSERRWTRGDPFIPFERRPDVPVVPKKAWRMFCSLPAWSVREIAEYSIANEDISLQSFADCLCYGRAPDPELASCLVYAARMCGLCGRISRRHIAEDHKENAEKIFKARLKAGRLWIAHLIRDKAYRKDVLRRSRSGRPNVYCVGYVPHLYDVLDYAEKCPDDVLACRNATFMSLLRRHNAWAAGNAAGRNSCVWEIKPEHVGLWWDCLISQTPFSCGGFIVEELTTPEALSHESLRMRNCVASYARYCIANRRRIFSLFNGTSRYTLEFTKDADGWYPSQLRGYRNGEPPSDDPVYHCVERLDSIITKQPTPQDPFSLACNPSFAKIAGERTLLEPPNGCRVSGIPVRRAVITQN